MRIAHLEELQRQVAQASALVRLQEERSPEFAPRVKEWLSTLERALAAHAPTQAAEVAGVRAVLVSAEQGTIPAGVTFRGRPTRTRVLNAVAAGSIPQATQFVARAVEAPAAKVAETESLVRQVVVLARFRRLVPAAAAGLVVADPGPGERRRAVEGLWRTFATTDELGSAVVRIEGLIGREDALVLLERELHQR